MMPPTIVVTDSLGEFALVYDSDSSKDYDLSRVTKSVIKPLTRAGHCLVLNKHIDKNLKGFKPFGNISNFAIRWL